MPVTHADTFDFRACRVEGSDRPIAILGPDIDRDPGEAKCRVDPLLGGDHAITSAEAASAAANTKRAAIAACDAASKAA